MSGYLCILNSYPSCRRVQPAGKDVQGVLPVFGYAFLQLKSK